MTLVSTKLRYGAVAQAFHWATFVLLATAWLVAHGHTRVLHETLGFAVFVIVAARLLWRLFDRRPEHEMSLAVALSSKLVHWLLYAMLIAIPATAIVGTWIEGHGIVVYGLGQIGPYLAVSRHLGRQIMEMHFLLANAIVVVAGAHAAAALFHHFFMRDGVLAAMLPKAVARAVDAMTPDGIARTLDLRREAPRRPAAGHRTG